jgi:predicted TIM-barrel fold metal-dependent hydrolase
MVHDGHPTAALREAAIERFLRRYPDHARFADVHVSDSPALRATIGARLGAAMVVGHRLLLDVFDDAQLAELLVGRDAGDAMPARSPDARIVDAHLHIAPGGAPRLLALLERNTIERAVVAPLAQSTSYDQLDETNLELLAAARAHPARITPLVMLSPLRPDPLGDLRRYLELGARGVKLMSGHDDFWVASGKAPLDSEPMRKVFAFCAQHRLPVLWHVNSHLHRAGLRRVLEDFPALVVVVPHLGGYLTHMPRAVRGLLARYPGLHVDLAWGQQSMYLRRSFEDLSDQHDAWRQVIVEFPERFLFGTDLVVTPDTTGSHAAASYHLYRSMVASRTYDLTYYGAAGHHTLGEIGHYRAGMHGLELPAEVLTQVLSGNATRVYATER